MIKDGGGSATPSLTSAEEDVLQHKDTLRVEVIPGGACIEPLTGSESSFISGRYTLSLLKTHLGFLRT